MSAADPRCLACGAGAPAEWTTARDVEYLTTPERFRYLRCGACDALSIDPVPRGRLAEIYPPNYYSYQGSGMSIIGRAKAWLDARFFRSVLAELEGDRLNVVDVGGGAGHELATLRSLDGRIAYTQVVDLDPGAEERARANGHAYFLGAVEDFQADRPLHLVMLLNLIEHVADPGRVLARIAAMLAPGGIVVVKTPNHDALDARLFRHHDWAGLHCPRHWVLFTRAGFEALATRAGLRVRRFAYTQGAPFWAASTLCWLAGRGLARVTKQRPVVYHPAFGLLSAAFAALDFARRPFARTSQMFFLLERSADSAV